MEDRARTSAAQARSPLIDWTKIEIKTTDLGNNTYLLEGALRQDEVGD